MNRISYSELLLETNIKTLEKLLLQDGIIIYPTDTLYGLGGNFFSRQVIEKIDSIKNREDMPYSVMVPGIDMIPGLVDSIPEGFHDLFSKLLPGKFTFLFNVSKTIDPVLVKGSDKIGIRIPGIPDMLRLIRTLNIPLITTSVNRSGEQPLNDPNDISHQFPGILLVDAGVLPVSGGSTIIDITRKPFACIRKGDDFEKLSKLGIEIV